MDLKRSPLAPQRFPTIPPIEGVRMAARACGIRYKGRADVMLAALPPGTAVAGVFTTSKTAAAPVDWCRKVAAKGRGRGLVVNAGNANAFNGAAGMAAVRDTAEKAAEVLGCKPAEVLIASTGVIGEPLPTARITGALAAMSRALKPNAWLAAAKAILTTDTFPKGAVEAAEIDGKPVRIAGIAKGSGMIAPNMATMLAFVFTDANIAAPALQSLLKKACDKTFNAITVDSDTSTSDTLLLFATGAAGHKKIKDPTDKRLKEFKKALQAVLKDLALQVVRDGEGAQKLIEVHVSGAASNKAAKAVALSIANSPLVKTAIAGADANWGRIVMAVGKSGERADRDKLTVRIGDVLVAENGQPVDGPWEPPATEHLKGQEVTISADLGIGKGKASVWTCDLTHGYIDINAAYRS